MPLHLRHLHRHALQCNRHRTLLSFLSTADPWPLFTDYCSPIPATPASAAPHSPSTPRSAAESAESAPPPADRSSPHKQKQTPDRSTPVFSQSHPESLSDSARSRAFAICLGEDGRSFYSSAVELFTSLSSPR